MLFTHRRAARSRTLGLLILVGLLSPIVTAQSRRPSPLNPDLITTITSGNHAVTLNLPRPNFSLKDTESLHPQITPEFTATFEGVVRVQLAGKYEFRGQPGNGVRLSIANQDALDKTLDLPRGDHDLKLEYTRPAGSVQFQLQWRSEHFPWEPIPAGNLGHKELPPAFAQQEKIERGRMLVEELNCIACHKASSPSLVGRAGPDLSDIGARVTPSWLLKWLEDPRHFRPQAVMPRLLSKEDNRRNVAAFLSLLKGPEAPPPAAKEPNLPMGEALYDSVGCTACHSEDPKHFSLAGLGSKYTTVDRLADYLLNPLKYDRSGRMPSMLLEPDEASAIAAHLMQSKKPEYEAPFPGGDPRVGQQLVRIIGCLNCHDITDPHGIKLPPLMVMAVKPLAQLTPNQGCLSPQVRSPMPIYALTQDDREAIGAFFTSFKTRPDVAAAPLYEFHRTATKFLCISCHNTRDTVALEGLELIPPLANSGMKLKEKWIEGVLLGKERVRPWVDRRMPHYGEPIRPVVAQILSTGGAPSEPVLADRDPAKVKLGQSLAGIGPTGLGCVGCHTYRNHEVTVPPESRGPEFTRMGDRVRGDWFFRWVRDPGRIQPNTAMPSFFTDRSIEEAHAQIGALWEYISIGKDMPPPEGLEAK